MFRISYVKKIIITAVFIALCVVLPMAFHSIPNAGSVFLPMHIPVLLCGMICGWNMGLICGLAGPLLSSLTTGMPPAAILPAMMVELAVYGVITGIILRVVHTKSLYADLYISLIIAMIAGRIAAGIVKALIFSAGNYSMAIWVSGHLITSIPGIVIQIILIPSLVVILQKAKLIPIRYQSQIKT